MFRAMMTSEENFPQAFLFYYSMIKSSYNTFKGIDGLQHVVGLFCILAVNDVCLSGNIIVLMSNFNY